jgi:hypothetical protein
MTVKPGKHLGAILGGLILLSLLLNACTNLQSMLAQNTKSRSVFLPPTAGSPARPIQAPGQPLSDSQAPNSSEDQALRQTAPPGPTATPVCTNSLTFIQDITVPDGSLFPPGEPMDKRWLVENSGTCNWEAGYRLKLVAGQALGARKEQALYPARSGTQATIRILFTAPDDPGTYSSAWQAYDPNGDPFGDPFFIEIAVQPSALDVP